MNVQGVIDTEHDQVYFWKACGSIAFVIILVTMVWAFRKSIADVLLWRRRRKKAEEKKEERFEV